MRINRLLTNLCSNNLQESKAFYTSLFEFTVEYDSDWFVHLVSEGRELEIGIMQSTHDLIPDEYRGRPTGMYLTLVVDDVTAIHKNALKHGHTVLKEPELTFYGQKRLLLKDPDCVLVDVSSPSNT